MVFVHRDGDDTGDPRIGGGFIDHQEAGDGAFLAVHHGGEVEIRDVVAIPEIEFPQAWVMGFQLFDADRATEQGADMFDPTGQVRARVRGGEKDDGPGLGDDGFPRGVAEVGGVTQHLFDQQPAQAVADKDDGPAADAIQFEQVEDVGRPVGERHGVAFPGRGADRITQAPTAGTSSPSQAGQKASGRSLGCQVARASPSRPWTKITSATRSRSSQPLIFCRPSIFVLPRPVVAIFLDCRAVIRVLPRIHVADGQLPFKRDIDVDIRESRHRK